MSPFEFYLSFYGLLLSLSVAQVAGGIGHAVVIRKDSHLGWLTPLFSLFVLLDIASFWIWAWGSRDVISINYATIYLGLLVALSYYLATVLLFPVRDGDWKDLDAHYWSNKRFVLAGIALANIIVLAHAFATRDAPFDASFRIYQALYWLPLAVLLVSRWKLVDGLCLVVLSGAYLSFAVVQNS
jgi:hypothetical protein